MSNLLEKLRKENNGRDKLLSEENNRIVTDMVVYLKSSKLCDYDIEVIRRELFGMLYEAQLREEPASQVIGTDYKYFCDELMRSGRQKETLETVLEWAYIGVVGLGVLFLIEVFFSGYAVDLLMKKEWMMPISLGFLLSAFTIIAVALGVYWYFTKYSFELSKKGLTAYKIWFVAGFTAFFAGVGMMKFFLGDQILFKINIAIPAVILGTAYIIVKILGDNNANQMAATHQ